MTRREACIAWTIYQEGGDRFTNDPRDPGGATKYGVTLARLREWRGKPELGADAVRALTEGEAMAIFAADDWPESGADQLPAGLDLMAFDFGVPAGAHTSAMLLQATVGVECDGDIGPETLRAVGRFALPHLIAKLAGRQRRHFEALPTFARFGRGELARTDRRAAAALAAVGLVTTQELAA